MTRKIILLTLLVWVVIVILGCLQRMNALGDVLNGNGPLALATESDGSTWVASRSTLYRLDADERLQLRIPAARLGLVELNALATGRDGILWIYDSRQLRPFRCQTQPLQCRAFGPESLALDINVQMAENHLGELLIADNTHHRIVRLSATGTLLDDGNAVRWHYPNQIMPHADGVYLADTDRYTIVSLPNTAAGTGQQALRNEERPYRFARRGDDWWVIEAGVTLERGVVRHYREGKATKLALDISDPTAIADNGRRLLVTSLTDWKLVSVDPATGIARSVNDVTLVREFSEQRRMMVEAKKERGRLPFIMMALMLPAIGVAGLVQKRSKESAATSDDTAKNPRRDAGSHRMATNVITPDMTALEQFQVQSRQKLLRAGLVLAGIMALSALALGLMRLVSPSLPLDALWLMLALMVALILLLAYTTYVAQRKQRQAYDQSLTLGKDKLVWSQQGKPRAAVAYKDIWIGPDFLLLGRHRLPLYLKPPGHRVPLWPVSDIQREVGMRIPAHQSADTHIQFMKALARHGRLADAGTIVLAGITPVLIVLLLILAKLWSKMDWMLLYWARH